MLLQVYAIVSSGKAMMSKRGMYAYEKGTGTRNVVEE
jgi:hypothetical protein